ncbi:DNA-binding IclR family transcriptional regulator [Thermocatellispora tengchongensis]|uniref:DNA-binding IclR family transcriptional regulator n=1 Tax=Thermocatellispora tengchongensis TaxID=1073253 RepID=A0A840PM53_9ACTN|nr:IclR family transcriptional regulator [Thermocatellispora tengchongensis]MBB5137125.1 DNA-binding IclR family transcriptional regulator [Thermocatellispora tengchongensis]
MPPKSDESYLHRVSRVLGAFRAEDDAVGAAELARRTGLPRSTVHRITLGLIEEGLLERCGTEVRLGLRLFEIGQRVPRQRVLRDAALPYMADLREATRQTVHLAVLEGREVVYVEILGTPGGPALPSRVGGRLPAHATGVGKAILAFSPPEVTRAVLDGELARVSERSLVAPGLLARELARIRRDGVAYDNEESGRGIVCAASPVHGRDGEVLGALSVSGWVNRVRLARVAPAVHTAALALSRTLGYRGPAQTLRQPGIQAPSSTV